MVGGIIALVGLLVATVAGFWLLFEAFKEHVGWGLASFFIPFVLLIFSLMHLDRTSKPLLLHFGGLGLMVLGSLLGAGPAPAG